MIYLKKFSTKENYLNYRDGKDYQKPNLSLCKGNDTVYYGLNSNGHPYVDLGLPSGTLWATMNVGASKPSDYGKYLIKDYLQTYVYNYTEAENDDNLSYLEDMFYTDSNGLVQHRTNREPKDKQYATFVTPIEDRLYHYTLRDDISDDDDVRLYIMTQFFEEFGSLYIIKTFNEDEVNKICKKISGDANLIKKADEKRYNNYLNLIKHYGKQYNDEDFVKYYFFNKYCINPKVTVKRNSKEYWSLRKDQHKYLQINKDYGFFKRDY